jgi:hypothetical protein
MSVFGITLIAMFRSRVEAGGMVDEGHRRRGNADAPGGPLGLGPVLPRHGRSWSQTRTPAGVAAA